MRIFALSLVSAFAVWTMQAQSTLLADAEALYIGQDYPKAQRMLEKIIGADDENPRALHLMANCLQKQERFVQAVQHYEKASRLAAPSPALQTDHAAALINLKQYKEAEKLLKKALKADPDLPEAHYFYGNVKYFDFNLTAALKHYNKATELRTDYRDALYMRAAAYAETGKFHLAVRDYEEVAALDPGLTAARFNIAVIHLQNDSFEKSAEMLAEINPADLPSSADYFFSLGEALYFAGEREEACTAYKRAASEGDEESDRIYKRYCLTKEEREAAERTRTIRMAF